MSWKRKVAVFGKQVGPAAKFAATTVLGTLLPGSPAVVELVAKALDCAHQTADEVWEVETRGASAAHLERVGALLETLGRGMGDALAKLGKLEALPDIARDVLDAQLATDATLGGTLKEVARLADGLEQLDGRVAGLSEDQRAAFRLQHWFAYLDHEDARLTTAQKKRPREARGKAVHGDNASVPSVNLAG